MVMSEGQGQGRGQGSQSLTLSLFGLLLLAVMSTGLGSTQALPRLVSAARPVRYTLPTFLDTPVNVTEVVGQDVVLPCSVKNLGPKSVTWKKISQAYPISVGTFVFDPDERYKVLRGETQQQPPLHHNRRHKSSWGRLSHEDPRWDLLIRNVDFADAGVYECMVSIKEDLGRNVTLKVMDDPSRGSISARHNKTGIMLTGTLYVEKGQTIDLNCTATSIDYRPKSVDWFKDGSKLRSGSRHLFTNYVEGSVLHSRLQVEHSVMGDAGTYVCRFSQHHVSSVKVIVLNTDTYNRRRGTVSGTESQHGKTAAKGTTVKVTWHWGVLLLLATLSLLVTS